MNFAVFFYFRLSSVSASIIASIIILIGTITFLISPLLSQKKTKTKPKIQNIEDQKSTPPKPISKDTSKEILFISSIEEVVRLILNNSDATRLKQLEILKADTGLRKTNSPYAPSIASGWQRQKTKNRYTNSFTSGDTTEIDSYFLKAKRLFSSGTYFEVQIADIYKKSDEIENPLFPSTSDTSDIFSPATLHSTQLSVVLKQELLKNAFGYSHRRSLAIQENIAEIERQHLINEITSILVSSMINFWKFKIAHGNIKTASSLLKNTHKVLAITRRKKRIGLAESFEISQWKALIANAKSILKTVNLQYDKLRRDLRRTLNLKSNQQLSHQGKLNTVIPNNLDIENDLKMAYQKRPDFKSLQLHKKNIKRVFEITKNNLLPSVSVNAQYAWRGFDPNSGEAYSQSSSGEYPDYSVGFSVEYPLWDDGLRVDLRDAKINLEQIEIEEKQLKGSISDEINHGFQEIQVSYQKYKNAQEILKSNRTFYSGILKRYRQGRFSATAVKNALDTLVQSEQGLIEAIINFNISIVRYDLSRNFLFEKYNVDIDQLINKLKR